MLFHSIDFIIFFPVVVLVYFVLPDKVKNYWLLIASYYFYMNWNAKYALLLLGTSLITYMAAFLVDRWRGKSLCRLVFVLALIAVFAILAYFKYMNFALQSLQAVLALCGVQLYVPVFDIVLPVGISFFTFQAAGYLIDVYRGETEVEKNLFRYLLFVSFFPQLVAGPIERSKNLLRQMHHVEKFEIHRVQRGLLIMLWGYFLKLVIADRCATFVDLVFEYYWGHGSAVLFIGAILFSLQIYCDFMGYSTIARGAALVLGYELMDNFRQPYFATSIQDFWRRWHISLSTWFKDYVYIPLGGNRCSKVRHFFNLMVTFLTSGLWHGADWTFVIWGGLHGVLQILGIITKPIVQFLHRVFRIREDAMSYHIFCVLRTDFLAVMAWIFFRAVDLEQAVDYIRQMFTGGIRLYELADGTLYGFGVSEFHFNILLIGLGILFVFSFLRERRVAVLSWLGEQNVLFRYVIYWILVLLIALSFSLNNQEFIYFQF